MSSMITLGVSFLLFFIVLGFMWLIGAHVLSELFLALPVVQNPDWAETVVEVEDQIKMIFIWTPPILVLFASIKMMLNAASRGAD